MDGGSSSLSALRYTDLDVRRELNTCQRWSFRALAWVFAELAMTICVSDVSAHGLKLQAGCVQIIRNVSISYSDCDNAAVPRDLQAPPTADQDVVARSRIKLLSYRFIMTTNAFTEFLKEKGTLLIDGAMGTNLFDRGLISGDAPELWNVDRPDDIRAVYRNFINAGSDIFLTNSFGGNRYRLMLHSAEDQARGLSRAAAALAREEADACGRKVLVAGSMGPTGEIMAPVGTLSHDDAADAFRDQAIGLKEGGADLFWIETISSREELAAAIDGVSGLGLPIVATLTFDTNGRTMMGLTPADAVAFLKEIDAPLSAFGANCGVGAAQLVDTVKSLREAAGADLPIIAKGNCGIPEYIDGQICYSGTPEVMATYARMSIDSGANIIGGCCGTKAEHVASMRAVLDAHSKSSEVPTRVDIEAALGTIDAPEVFEIPDKAARPQRNRRRRQLSSA